MPKVKKIIVNKSLFFSGNNNAFPKEGLQWRGGKCNNNLSNGGTNGGSVCDDGESGGCIEGSAAAGTDQLEGSGPTENDALHLKRRVGLISGVALIVGTMIGKNIFK